MTSQYSKHAPYLPQHKTFDPENSRLFKIQIEGEWIQIALRVNERIIGNFYTNEQVAGIEYFGNTNQRRRSAYRKVVNFGQLPNAGAKAVAHNLTITSDWKFTHIYATASDTSGISYIPVPNSFIVVDATNVTITTTSDLTAYNECYVVLEYLKE
jgi:hypothetical protein